MDTLGQTALAYARDLGWRVVPIMVGTKRPAIERWPDLATTDPATVEEWWSNGHRGCGVGIATGEASGIFVLDVDDDGGRAKCGSDTLDALTAEHGALPLRRWC